MDKQVKSREAFEEERAHGKQGTKFFYCDNYTTDARALSRKVQTVFDLIGAGERNAIHQKDISDLTGLSGREITHSIEALRRSGKVILSSNKGYFKPGTMAEVNAHIRRERSRAKNILKTLKAAEKYKSRGGVTE